MKKLLVIAAILASAVGVRAAALDGTVDATSQGNPISDVGGSTKLSGNSFLAALYWSTTPTVAGSFVPFTTSSGAAVAAFPFLTGGGAGFWDSGANGTLYANGQAAGTSVSVIARAWNASAGTFAAASTPSSTVGNKSGFSAPITVTLGNSTASGPPTFPADISGLQAFNLTATPTVPEPSTIALSLIGAGALLLRRRK